MAALTPYVLWPGAVSISSLSYTVGHGISPTRAIVRLNPQPNPPQLFGDLVFGDGVREITLRDCIVDDVREEYGSGGRYYILEILDRRWRWQTGLIPGKYNLLDDRGKLVPWTIRSPVELATLCLQAMGETSYQIKLPNGLSSLDIPQVERLLKTGENFPQSLANPTVIWEGIPPALALQRLAETYGCRVAWDPVTDMVGIGPLGDGDGLPLGGTSSSPLGGPSVASSAAGVSATPAPYAVGVRGAPIRHQMRFWLEPVGEDWDGRFVPLSQLSYAPTHPFDQKQRYLIQLTPFFTGSMTLTLTNDYGGVTFTASGTKDVIVSSLISQINAKGIGLVADRVLSTAFTITAKFPEFNFDVFFQAADLNTIKVICDRRAMKKGTIDWSMCPIPTFETVTPTDRLSKDDAIRLAQGSVWRCYRIMIDAPKWVQNNALQPAGLTPPLLNGIFKLPIPGITSPGNDSLGKPTPELVRRHQFTLMPTKVEQVDATKSLFLGQIAVNLQQPRDRFSRVVPEFYNGVSRDQTATVSGNYSRSLSGVTSASFLPDSTSPDNVNYYNKRLFMPFQVVPQEQMIQFGSQVYKTHTYMGGYFPAEIILETSALFEDAFTSEMRRSQYIKILGGPGPIAWRQHDDVQAHLIANYDKSGYYISARQEDFEDGGNRAQYYLDGHAAEYQLKASEHKTYNGVYNVSITGRVQQVSWSISGSGCFTQAGLNTEFSINAAPYPARRMVENLPPDVMTAMLNTADPDKLPNAQLPGVKSLKSLVRGGGG